MSQSTVSIDVASSVAGAANQQPAPRSADPGRQSEFAAHLRQAGREAGSERSSRVVRGGGSPDRASSGHDDGATPDADGSTTDSTSTTGGSTTTPAGADSQPAGTPASADPAANLPIVAATATVALAPAAQIPAAAAGVVAGAVTGAEAKSQPQTAGVGAATTATGAIVAPTARGTVDPSAVTGAVGRTGARGPASVVAGGTVGSTPTAAPTASAGAHAAGTDPSAVRSTGSRSGEVAGAVAGTVDPSAVVGVTTTPPNAAPLTFSPLGADTTAVSATSSSTAASAPAPTSTAPQTSVATQLAASLRTLSGRGDGVHVMTVRLHPDELGPVRIVARLTGTEVHLRVTASSIAAAAAVSDAAPRLHDALASSGLTTTGVSVDHDADLGGQASQGGQHQGHGTAGTSADGRDTHHADSSRENRSAPGGFGRGVHLDVDPTTPPSRHPAARSLDLHV